VKNSCAGLSRRSILAAGLAACAVPLLPRPARAQDAQALRIAYQPYAYSAQVLYAREMGIFAKAALNVTLQEIAFGSALATAVASGAVDIGIATVNTLAVAHSKKLPFVIIAPAATFDARKPATGYLMAGNQAGIKTGKDFNGKTIGTPGLATLGEYGVRAWVDANGGDSSTLKFQELPFSQMPAAFAAGRIDAGFIGDPFLAEARKYAHPVAREMDAMGQEYMITAWFSTTSWAAAHPDAVARFAAAMRETSTWAAKNPQKCVDILAQTFKQERSTIDPAGLPSFPQRVTPTLLEPMIGVTAKYGKFAAFPADELIYTPPRT
jgi:NitT/TauT family transport system substrate-binding protein